jgi:prepilin-type N-terminal cleavage/methylation domain-containing protein
MKRIALSHRPGHGFTLIELLVTISIVALLVTGAFSAFGFVMRNARKTDARNTCMTVLNAVEQYQSEYHRLPETSSFARGEDTDCTTEPSEGLIAILKGLDETQNSQGTDFLGDIKPASMQDGRPTNGLHEEGETMGLYDPWGQAYRVRMDHGNDDKVENPNDKQTSATGQTHLRKQCIVWSEGDPKRVQSGGSIWEEAAVASWSDK